MEKAFYSLPWSPSVFSSVGCYFPIVHARLAFNPATSAIAKNRKVTAAWTRSIDIL